MYRTNPQTHQMSLTRQMGHRIAIPLAIVLAVGARLLLPATGDGVGAAQASAPAIADAALPDRAAEPPRERPGLLPAGLALMVDPISVSPLSPIQGH